MYILEDRERENKHWLITAAPFESIFK